MRGRWVAPLLAGLAAVAPASPLPLRADDPALWQRKVFVEAGSGVAEADAASFAFTLDPEAGPVLSVGPWRAGEWSARLEWSRTLPAASGVVTGRYRTDALAPYDAEITVTFLARGRRIARRTLHPAPAEAWTEFALPVGPLPPGADALTLGFGLGAHTGGRADFAGLAFDPAGGRAPLPAVLPEVTRPAPPAFLPAGGFFRVMPRDGVWWLVSPSGKGVYAAGVDAPPLPRLIGRQAAGRAHAAWLAAHGFNALGGWTDVWRWGPVLDRLDAGGSDPILIAFASLESGGPALLRDAKGRPCGGTGHEFPDPFDPRFAEAYRRQAEDVARAVRGKRWFAAWFADNERCFEGLERCVWSPACAAAFRAFLAGRYPDAPALNRAWGTAFASLDALVAARPEPPFRAGAMREDYLAFARRIVETYARVTLAAIKAADPDHLVFTNRFNMDGAGNLGRYLDAFAAFDGVAVNLYPENAAAGLSANERAELDLVARRTDKPLLIGEWSVPAADSGLYADPRRLDWSWNEAMPTQEDRARQAATVATDFYDLPYVVGASWFTWSDADSRKRRANRGLMRSDGRPWDLLAEALGAVQRRWLDR